MAEEFKKILTLIDFSHASLHAADEAALIASKFNSQLYLLYVDTTEQSHFFTPKIHFAKDSIIHNSGIVSTTHALEKIKAELEDRTGINVIYHEVKGNLCETINNYVHELKADLVVLGINHKSWIKELFGKNKMKTIIKNLDTEVLSVYPDSNSSRLKKIVLPIGKFIPKRKIRLAYELAKRFTANVHLISLNKNGNSLNTENTKILMASYQYLKDITNIPVECRTVPGNNLAQATVQYAENIGADLILVNAGTETFFKTAMLGRWRGSILDHSSIPVLSVHAINEKSIHRNYRA